MVVAYCSFTFFVVSYVLCVLCLFICLQSNPPQVVQDKILSLIQDWADAFRGSPELSYVLETYESLRAQGLKVFALFGVVLRKTYVLQL